MKRILICFMLLVPFMLYGAGEKATIRDTVEWSPVIKIDTCFKGYNIYGDVKGNTTFGGEEVKLFEENVLARNHSYQDYILRNALKGIYVVIPEKDAKKMKLVRDSSKVDQKECIEIHFPTAYNKQQNARKPDYHPGDTTLCLVVRSKIITKITNGETGGPKEKGQDTSAKILFLFSVLLSVFALIFGGVALYALGRKRHHKDSLSVGAQNPPTSTARAYEKDLLKEDVVPRLRELKEALGNLQNAVTNFPVQMSNEVKVPILNELRNMEGQMNARKAADVTEHVALQPKQRVELDYSDGKLNLGGNKFFYVTANGRNDVLQLYVNEDKQLRELLKWTFRDSYVDVIDFKPIDINGEECIEPGRVQKNGGNYVITQKVIWHYPSYV